MADIDTTQILVALILAVFSLSGVWVVNGHLARTFEKRKRKYEVKLDKYSVIVETFGLLALFGNVARLHMSVSKLLEISDKSESVERDYDPGALLFEYWYSLLVLKAGVGLDVTKDYGEAFAEGRLMGIPVFDGEGNDEDETKEEMKKFFWSQTGDLLRCMEMLVTRLSRDLSVIKVIGNKPLVEKAERILLTIIVRTFTGEYYRFGKKLEIENLVQLPANWQQMISDFEEALATDLEGTL